MWAARHQPHPPRQVHARLISRRSSSSGSSLLLEMLPGWRGIDTAESRAESEADAVLTLAQAEHLVATWIVKIWQNRELGETGVGSGHPGCRTRCSPPRCPGRVRAGTSGPGAVLPAAARAPGEDPRPPRPSAGCGTARRWTPTGPSPRPRAARQREVEDPPCTSSAPCVLSATGHHEWHALRWTGLQPEGEVPSFSDLRADDLLRAARARPACSPVGCRTAAAPAEPDRRPDPRRCLADPDEPPAAHRARPRSRRDQAAADWPAFGTPAAAAARQDNGKRRRGRCDSADAVAGSGPRCHRSRYRAARPPWRRASGRARR